jgi:UDP-N-acetylmuramoylalanine--D-glutamate ligase
VGWSSFPIESARSGFSLREEQISGAFLSGDKLVLRQPGLPDRLICRREELRLRGIHNVANVLAASCLASLAGAEPKAIAKAAISFEGMEHRLEVVRRLRGVVWVNDSIATSPERAVAAMESFSEPLVLLAGGRDKDLVWDEFARQAHRRVRHMLLFGEASALIEGALELHRPPADELVLWDGQPMSLVRCSDLEEAVARAHQQADSGDVVLLAPGGTSFDMYRDFAARGDHFRALVNELGE